MSDENNKSSEIAPSQQQQETFSNPKNNAKPIKYAGFWIRSLALFIDGIILILAFYIIQTLTGIELTQSYSSSESAYPESWMVDFIGFLISICYATLTTGSSLQATLGKKMLGLRVIRSEGSRITYLRAFGRYWATILSGITLCIGYIIAAFTDQKKALHDMIADTRVIYISSLQ